MNSLNKNIKAQVSQVFVWIIVALVIGATALFGVRSIGGLLEDKCSIDQIRFEDKLKETISLNNDFGAVHLEVLSAPCDYSKVCLVDARPIMDYKETDSANEDLVMPEPEDPGMVGHYQFMHLSVLDGVEDNVFLYDGKTLTPAGYIPQIRIDYGDEFTSDYLGDEYEILCIDAKAGRFNFILQGLGRNTWVKSVEQHNKNT